MSTARLLVPASSQDRGNVGESHEGNAYHPFKTMKK